MDTVNEVLFDSVRSYEFFREEQIAKIWGSGDGIPPVGSRGKAPPQADDCIIIMCRILTIDDNFNYFMQIVEQ